MESRLDAMLAEQDRQVAEDEHLREKRVLPCTGSCHFHRIHEWNPFSESWNCAKCGAPRHDQEEER